MSTKANVDADLCIGSTECNRIANAAFLLDDDTGVSVVLPGASETDPDVLVDAAGACPTMAIRLRRADGSVLFGDA
jgi:ferredoxin